MKAVGIIPARYGSVRFPGKALADLLGKPLIQWVYERAKESGSLERVIVATDDQRIVDAVNSFGGDVELTSPNHTSGTERVAEVAKRLDSDLVVNIQGDQPLVEPRAIDSLVYATLDSPQVEIGTLIAQSKDEDELKNPNVVKVVFDRRGFALYFSRHPIPWPGYPRSNPRETTFYKHIGVYAYKRDALVRLADLPPSPLEMAEGLEQLRALENGLGIKVVETPYPSWSVDTKEDLTRVERLLSSP